MNTLKFVIGFAVLNLSLRLVPSLVKGNDLVWLAVFVSFFPLAHFLARWSSHTGLNGLGLARNPKWKKFLLLGLIIGGLTWMALTLAELAFGSLKFIEWQSWDKASWVAVQALVASFLGSATNDVMTRGYVFAHWKNRLSTPAIVLLSTALYIADDMWMEGWSMRNNIFSLILGLAFALSVVRTRSLWMNIGLHAGLNLIYFLVYGMGNQNIHSGVFTSVSQPHPAAPYLGMMGGLIILAMTLWLSPHTKSNSSAPKKVQQQRQLQEQEQA